MAISKQEFDGDELVDVTEDDMKTETEIFDDLMTRLADDDD